MNNHNIDIAFKFAQRPTVPVDPPSFEYEEVTPEETTADAVERYETSLNVFLLLAGVTIGSMFILGLNRWLHL